DRWTKLGASYSTKVRVGPNYATEDYDTDTASLPVALTEGQVVKVLAGDTVDNGDGTLNSLYKYIGLTPITNGTDLDTLDYNVDTLWKEIDGEAGEIYRYVGTAATIVLGTEDYTDTANWEKLTISNADYVPNIGNVTGSDSVGIGGLVVRNDVRSDVDAHIDNMNVAAGGNVKVDALSDALIEALGLSEVSSSGGSAFGTGTSLAVNATIASNLVQGSTIAEITNSQIGDNTTAVGGDVEVTADNTSGIDATLNSSTSTGDTAVGVTLAFNTIGWQSQNVLYKTIDALLGDDLIGTEDPAEAIARVTDSSVDATGNLTVTADNRAVLNATVSNAAVSEASALFGATGLSASAILASNKVSTDTRAYVEETDATGTTTVDVGGNVTVEATDEAGVYSNSKLVSSSTTTNDGGASVAQETISDFLDADHESGDTVMLKFGDRVRLDDSYGAEGVPGGVYEYLGIDDYNPTTSTTDSTTDLSGVDYTDKGYWKLLPESDVIPQGYNVSDSDSIGIGGLIVTNDVRAEVDAHLRDVTVDAGGNVAVNALENATIVATADSTVSSSGGSAYGSGTSLAVNGVIATNTVLGSAHATVEDSTLGADGAPIGGDLVVTADNTATIEATNLSATTSGDTAVGMTLAFNTVGWRTQNLIFNSLDMLLGTSIAEKQSADSLAIVDNSTVHVAGDVDVTADTQAGIVATVGNESTSAASALFGATGMSISGVLAGNMVSSTAQAYIGHDWDFDSSDLTYELLKGDRVRHDGNVYQYDGADITRNPFTPDFELPVDLSSADYTAAPWTLLSTSLTAGIASYDHVETDTPESVLMDGRVKLDTGEVYERINSDRVAYLDLSAGGQSYAGGDWTTTTDDIDYESTSTTTTTVYADDVVNVEGTRYKYQGGSPLQAVLDLTDATVDYENATDWQLVATAVTDGVEVRASDDASIDATSRLVSSSSTSNDGGASILNTFAQKLLDDYQFTSKSGSQTVAFGDRVRVDDNFAPPAATVSSLDPTGKVFQYMGVEGTVDLGTAQDYSDYELWKELDATNIIPNGLNVSDSDSVAIGGLVVRNDVDSDVDAFINDATVLVAEGDLAVVALESAQ
ncbi:MAG: hypothetical protein GY708_29070, partial [Actinomycetia bacterium]|nr:hypothetical protein [Actinomycetes bacterium]